MMDKVVAAPPVDTRPDAAQHAFSGMEAKPAQAVLVVDDEPSTLAYLEHVLQKQGYRVLCAQDGEAALKVLSASGEDIAAVVMDLHMPTLSGLEVVEAMKQCSNLDFIPVIMTTASQGPEVVREGVEAGVYYCLHKPIDPALLVSLVDAASRECDMTKMRQEALNSQRGALEMMGNARFTCRTLREVAVLSQFLAAGYPDPQRAIIGITELLTNAVEHGNLGLSYDEKRSLMMDGRWAETIKARQGREEYAGRCIDIVFQRKADGIYLQISDEGEGFEWWRYLEIDPARATHPNGRGIALANKISFDRLQFSNNGSRVVGVVNTEKKQPRRADGKLAELNW